MISIKKIKQNIHRTVSPTLMNIALVGTAFGSSTIGSYYSKNNRNTPNGKASESRDAEMLNSVSQIHTLNRAQRRKAERNHQCLKASELKVLANKQVSELFIIDGAVHDKDVLIDAVNRPGAEVLVLQHGGVVEMVRALGAYSNLKAIHVLSHAKAGELLIGNERITKSRLNADPFILDALNDAMAEGADLLLYGCELAESNEGEELLEIISQGAHIDVAASDDLTGNAEYNGDWDLEISTGDIEADILADSPALKNFTEVLQDVNFTDWASATGAVSDTIKLATGGETLVVASVGTSLGVYAGYGYTNSSNGTSLTFSLESGNTFTLKSLYATSNSFDMTITPSSGSAITRTVTYTVATQTGTTLDINDSNSNSDFTNITSFTLTGNMGSGDKIDFSFDNIVLTNILSSGGGVTADNTPPIFENSTPSTSAITTSGVTLATDIDEEGTIYYAVFVDNAPAPTSADLVVGTGNAAAAITSGSQLVNSGNFSHNFSISGLNPGTPYDIYIVAQDDETSPNLQTTPELEEFATQCAFSASISSHTDLSCNGDNSGSATASVSSGAANYDYAWSNGTNNNSQSSVSNSISGLAAGTYTVTVTDANGCTATASETLSEPAVLTGGSISF